MRLLAAIVGCSLLLLVLVDAFQTIVLARRAQRLFRPTRIFYRLTWTAFAGLAKRIRSGKHREDFLSVYGPLSLLTLLGLWALGVIFSFALLQWSAGAQIETSAADFHEALYFSAATFLTLGLYKPTNVASMYLMALEAGIGFSLFGLVIGYLPVLYQSFSDREIDISLLDARAGSPPSGTELVVRQGSNPDRLERQLERWEQWAAELLESQLSYPMLAYFRSQHSNQSWLGALTAILDASSAIIVAGTEDLKRQAELTFAMGRHALVDLSTVFSAHPRHPEKDRLPSELFMQLRNIFATHHTPLRAEALSESELKKLRDMYEPYAHALGVYFLIGLPHWVSTERRYDNWQITPAPETAAPFAVSDAFVEPSGWRLHGLRLKRDRHRHT